MRSMWTGSLAFGMVHIPVKMYTATEDHSVRFNQVHVKDGGRIRMKRFCTECGEEVAYADIGKGYESAAGQRVVFEPDDFDDLPQGPKKEIDVLEFVPSEQVDPVLFDRTYYLEPDERALKPYVLLRQALESTERTAIIKIAIRQRTQLGALRVRDDVLVLQTMLWPDEVREAEFDFVGSDVDVRPQELQMAQSLISNLSADFDPEKYTDEYREAILAVIEAKLAGGEGIPVDAAGGVSDGPGVVVDLMAALQASIAQTTGSGAASSKSSATATRKPAAKKAPSNQAASKQTAPKQAAAATPAKRTSTRKTATKVPAKGPTKAPAKVPAARSAAASTAKKAAKKAPARKPAAKSA